MSLRRRIAALVAGALAVAGLGVTMTVAAPAPAAAADIYTPPADGTWSIQGHGWGHGIGMSQWGAYGAALQGVSYTQILDFYYPGTTMRTIGNPVIRVLLGPQVVSSSAVTVWAPSGGSGLLLINGVLRDGLITLTPRPGGGYLLEKRVTAGGPVVGSDTYAESSLTISSVDPALPAVTVAAWTTSGQGTLYRGSITVHRVDAGIQVVNHVPMESYLRGVVPKEMPTSWHSEALRVQAVAARSYTESTKSNRGTWDICDTTQCQVYGGASIRTTAGTLVSSVETARSDSAISSTAGQVRWYNGAAAFTQFSSSNGGHSVRGSQPYLVAQPDPWSGSAPGDPVSTWSAELSVATVQAQCPSGGTLQRLVIVSRDGRGEWGGRITEARVECTTGNRTITNATTLRFGMRSNWWRPLEAAFVPKGIFLSNTNSGQADIHFEYGTPADTLLYGDWNGDGIDTFAVRRGNVFHVRNSLTSGPADYTFTFGNPGDVILVGDWNGDGIDTLAVRRGDWFHVRNSTTTGVADVVFSYGNPGDVILVGDWDGDGKDTLAVRRGDWFHVRNSTTTGVADVVFSYGNPGDHIHVGDFDGDGKDTLAVQRGTTFYVRNSVTSGVADLVFGYGNPGDRAFFGDWDGDGKDTIGVIRR